jgi:hypothetical protein
MLFAPLIRNVSPIMAMHVLEITVPGQWLDAEDRSWAWGIENLLRLLEDTFVDACVALNLFEEESARMTARFEPAEVKTAQDRLQADVQEELHRLEGELGSDVFWANYLAVHDEAALAVHRRRWERGEWPEEFERRKAFLHAHSFVFLLDRFRRALEALAQTPDVPELVIAETAAFRAAFRQLKGLRDSAIHLEDRGRGLRRGGQPLELRPIENRFIKASGGVLALGNLDGSKLGYTTEDGKYAEVDVSVESLLLVRDSLQKVITAFRWHGVPRRIPYTG